MDEPFWPSFGAKPQDLFVHGDFLATEFRAVGRWARNVGAQSVPKPYFDKLFDSYMNLYQKLERCENERASRPISQPVRLCDKASSANHDPAFGHSGARGVRRRALEIYEGSSDEHDPWQSLTKLPYAILDADNSVIARFRDGPAFAALERLLPEILQTLLEDQSRASLLPLPHGFLDTSIADDIDNAGTQTPYPRQHQNPQLLAPVQHGQEDKVVGATHRGLNTFTHNLTAPNFRRSENIREHTRRSSINGGRDRIDPAAVAMVVNEQNHPIQPATPVKQEPEDTIADNGGLGSIVPAQMRSHQDAEVNGSTESGMVGVADSERRGIGKRISGDQDVEAKIRNDTKLAIRTGPEHQEHQRTEKRSRGQRTGAAIPHQGRVASPVNPRASENLGERSGPSQEPITRRRNKDPDNPEDPMKDRSTTNEMKPTTSQYPLTKENLAKNCASLKRRKSPDKAASPRKPKDDNNCDHLNKSNSSISDDCYPSSGSDRPDNEQADSSDDSDDSEGERAVETSKDPVGTFPVKLGPWPNCKLRGSSWEQIKMDIYDQNNLGGTLREPADIRAVGRGWSLAGRENLTTVYFALPEQANEAISHGLFCDGQLRSCTKYNPDYALQACTRCWAWGHKGAACIHRRRCYRCASESSGHTHKQCIAAVKCCNCNGAHNYRASGCPVKVAEMKRLSVLEAKADSYFPTEGDLPENSTSAGPRKETHSARFSDSAAAGVSCNSHGGPRPAKRRKHDREPRAAVTLKGLAGILRTKS
ncbi:MAG: hypothetical protein Q9214_005481 [Letrouitia sp. 1 TL-2023]